MLLCKKKNEVLDLSIWFWHYNFAYTKPLGKSPADKLISKMERVCLSNLRGLM